MAQYHQVLSGSQQMYSAILSLSLPQTLLTSLVSPARLELATSGLGNRRPFRWDLGDIELVVQIEEQR